jgi:hypothetical protein
MTEGTGACVVYAVTYRTTFHNYSSKRYAVNYYLLRRGRLVGSDYPLTRPSPAGGEGRSAPYSRMCTDYGLIFAMCCNSWVPAFAGMT